MREDEFGALLFAAAIIENDMNCIKETIDFLKLVDVMSHQPVGFAHFYTIFDQNAPHILARANDFLDEFDNSYTAAIEIIHDICDSMSVNPESPLGIVVKKGLLSLETMRAYLVPPFIASYRGWLEKFERNPLPLALSPDQLFSEFNPELILSPLPDYDIPHPEPSDIEAITGDSHQLLLYRALYHARQQKTALAIEEMTQCCLKMTETEDSSYLYRSSVTLAQLFDILGLKNDAVLALNESISGARGIADTSVISTAVALKAQIDGAKSSWEYASEVPNPHPIATVKHAFQNDNLSKAVATDPLVTLDVFSQCVHEIARLVPLSVKTLPIRVLKHAEECEWNEAASLLTQLDSGILEVRATALALVVAFLEVNGNHKSAEVFRQDLEEVLEIEIGHFSDYKPMIRSIANVYSFASAEIDPAEFPIDRPILSRLRWMCESAKTKEEYCNVANMCAKCMVRELYDSVAPKCEGCEILECPVFTVETFDVILVISQLASAK